MPAILEAVAAAKADIDNQLAGVLTQLHQDMRDINNSHMAITAEGARVVERVEMERAAATTYMENIKAEASSEFGRRRNAIESVNKEVHDTQAALQQELTWVKSELEKLKETPMVEEIRAETEDWAARWASFLGSI